VYVSYHLSCVFTHATCEFRSSFPSLKFAHRGACTLAPSTVTPTTTIAGTTTTVMAATSTDPIANIVQKVFCQNIDTINCGHDFKLICGSDGKFYPNQ
jgi:hypothetical protein